MSEEGLLCPECEGEGGWGDDWGNWIECPCCHGDVLTPERLAEYNREVGEDAPPDERDEASRFLLYWGSCGLNLMRRMKFWFWKMVRRAADYVETWAHDIYLYAHERVCDNLY